MLENPRLYFSGRAGSNYATPKNGSQHGFRPSSKSKSKKPYHIPGSYLNSKQDTNSILNDSIMRNSRYYTSKNYTKGGYNNVDKNSQGGHKYYSLDHKRGVVKNDSYNGQNYSMERERSKYLSGRGRSEKRDYSKYGSVRNYNRKAGDDYADGQGGGTKKMLDKMIKKMMNKHNRKGKFKFPENFNF